MPAAAVMKELRRGIAIPAHPLALTADGKFDERSQRALSRYYHASGAGGIAVGVHTTQFEIREPRHGLLRPVLQLAAETFHQLDRQANRRTVRIAGVCGRTSQAVGDACLARDLGYDAGMISLAAWKDGSDDQLIEHCKAVAEEIPIIGFYLQPAVGGRPLSIDFWRQLSLLPNLVAIKIAPFDRYKTHDVIRAVAEVERGDEIALYTGNDDSIVMDLLTEYRIQTGERAISLQMVGGLLGHWACWTQNAVQLLAQCHAARQNREISSELLTLATEVTDCNAALFDAANGFAGCIPGIHYVLKQQGLLASTRCLDPNLHLSPGQQSEIDRVRTCYPHLIDDDWVAEHLDDWMR
ncbi:dihydrodipicolinate synthase family protein [Allorhodopirellula solitaria]|nr:dihydrodipicolinate synthase family protein [Allorhodopirellula solitaria]